MSDKPTTSAASGRPPTGSASAAHTSSFIPPSHPPGVLGHGRHCSYENAFIKEEEEKSNADDLFALLPVDR